MEFVIRSKYRMTNTTACRTWRACCRCVAHTSRTGGSPRPVGGRQEDDDFVGTPGEPLERRDVTTGRPQLADRGQ
ncbi:MAG: hypothetical protein ACRDSZ_21820 [Pseudonocardiaceae bacterium]